MMELPERHTTSLKGQPVRTHRTDDIEPACSLSPSKFMFVSAVFLFAGHRAGKSSGDSFFSGGLTRVRSDSVARRLWGTWGFLLKRPLPARNWLRVGGAAGARQWHVRSKQQQGPNGTWQRPNLDGVSSAALPPAETPPRAISGAGNLKLVSRV